MGECHDLYFMSRYLYKIFRRASHKVLSLSLIATISCIPRFMFYVKAFSQNCFRALRESLNLSLIVTSFRMSRFIFYVKVFRQSCSSRFGRKFKFKFDRKHFANVPLYVLLEGIQTKIFFALRAQYIMWIRFLKVSKCYALYYTKLFEWNNSSGPLLCNTIPANLYKPAVQSIGCGSGTPKSKSC